MEGLLVDAYAAEQVDHVVDVGLGLLGGLVEVGETAGFKLSEGRILESHKWIFFTRLLLMNQINQTVTTEPRRKRGC